VEAKQVKERRRRGNVEGHGSEWGEGEKKERKEFTEVKGKEGGKEEV
jgi:hypothetical protein